MLTKLSNNRIDQLQCVIVPASHAFKKDVAMNGMAVIGFPQPDLVRTSLSQVTLEREVSMGCRFWTC